MANPDLGARGLLGQPGTIANFPGDRFVFDPGRRHAHDRTPGREGDRSHESRDGVDGTGRDHLAHGYTGHVVFGRPTALGGAGNPDNSLVRTILPAVRTMAGTCADRPHAPIAGWFWTVGHLAGPAAVVYLWFDGRRRCKEAASVPLAATILAVA